MFVIEILRPPVAWCAHQGYGKRSYNPRFKEKKFYQQQIRYQFNRTNPITSPVRILFSFYMPIPKATSWIRKQQMLNGILHHIKRPDCTNLQKFAEDCLKGIVIEDDSQVCIIESKKLYSEIPKTVIQIEAI